MFNEYVLILVWLMFMMLMLASSKRVYRIEYVCGRVERRVNYVMAFLVVFPIIWMAMNRTLWVGDTSMYHYTYMSMPDSISRVPSYVTDVPKDKGFYFMSALLKVIFGTDYRMYFLAIALFQGLVVAMLFRKYSNNYIFAIFLFVVSTDYISWMFNGIRQFMAVCIALLATPFLLEKTSRTFTRKYLPAIIIILIASTMHQSALLVIPFVIIAQGKAWNQKTLFFIFATLLAVLFVDMFTNVLDDALSTTQYVNVVSDFKNSSDDGTNPIRVLVYSIPAILSFGGRRTTKKQDNRVINFCTNMSIISMGLYVVSMVTSGIFIGRLPIYCSLYSYILLPWEIDNLVVKESRKTAYLGVVLLYLIYYYYQMHFIFGLI